MLSALKYNIKENLRKNTRKYIFLIICFIVSIVIGTIFSYSEKSEENTINYFLSVFKIQGINTSNLFLHSFFENLRFLILILISGYTLWLIPLNIFSVFAKGFSIGFTIARFGMAIGVKGVFMSISAMLFPNIIFIPTLIVYSVNQINFSVHRDSLKKSSSYLKNRKDLIKYSVISFLLSAIFSLLSALVDCGFTPLILKLFCQF